MQQNRPVVLVEDDTDDQEIMREVMSDLQLTNSLVIFENGRDAEVYLRTTSDQPFIILCDINMPVMNGLELRAIIENDPFLKQKSIPFVFLTTSRNPLTVRLAYDLTVQGFFQKKNNLADFMAELKMIFDYWKVCLHPNNGQSGR